MKKRNLKKSLALVLALTTLTGLVVGCGKTEEKKETSVAKEESVASSDTKASETAAPTEAEPELEPVTLKWYHPGEFDTEKEGTADVIEAFNAKLAELLPNTTVEFVFVSDYATNWSMLLAGGEKMDIAWEGYLVNYLQDVEDGNVMDITDLVEKYGPNLVKEREIWQTAYDTATLDGALYGIPSIQPSVQESQLFKCVDFMWPYLDSDAMLAEFRNNSKMTTKMLDIMEKAHEDALAAGAITLGDNSWNVGPLVTNMGWLGYKFLGAESNKMAYDPEADKIEAMHIWEMPEFKEALIRVAEWYDKGWVTETNVLGQLPDNSETTMGLNGMAWNQNWSNKDENGVELAKTTKEGRADFYNVMTNKPEEGYKDLNIFGKENTYLVVPYTSENPERAVMLLNLLLKLPTCKSGIRTLKNQYFSS